MLKTVRIRDLAIIEELVVEFGPGLNLLTGETGAGKSIVVDALGLASGDRADSRIVRAGAERAVVEAAFELPADSPVNGLLSRRGVDTAEGEMTVRREVAAEGSGRVFVNGTPCALGVLREAGALLVELHGQHEHQSLLSPERHLELLDRFGGLAPFAAPVAEACRAAGLASEELARLSLLRGESQRKAAEYQRRIREIDAVGPQPGEYELLQSERRLLRNAGRVAQILDELVSALYDGEPSAVSLAAVAARRSADLAGIDPSVEELTRRIEGARLELEDAGGALRDYRDRAEFDPARLERVESRLSALDGLRLRYGPDEAAVLEAREEASRAMAEIDDLEGEIERLQEQRRAAERRYADEASALGRARRSASRRLVPAVEDQLAALALGRARLEIAFTPSRGSAVPGPDGTSLPLHPRGAERAEFLLSANPGEPPRPLVKVGSGGEISRIMLALHAVLDGAAEGRVLVFDEVDSGVGGSAADAVGARLSRLSRRCQVLCVTHLPQVAAHAHRHYHVRKRVARGRTRAEIVLLSPEERVDELARMLGGRQVTEASRRNAKDLLAAASGAAQAGPRGKS